MDWNKKTAYYKIASVVFLTLAALYPVGRFFILRLFVDSATGFFTKNTVWSALFDYSFVVICAVFTLLAIVFRPRFLTPEERGEKNYPRVSFVKGAPLTAGSELVFSPSGTVRVFASAFFGFSLITFSAVSVLEYYVETPLDWAVQILAVLAGLYFLFQYSSFLPFYSARRALFSLIPLIWATLKLFNCFFKASRNATGEYHNWQIMSLALIAVFLYLQAQFNLPRRASYHYSLLFSSGMVGLCTILIYALPILVLFAFPSNPYDAFSRFTSIHDLIVELAAAFYLGVYAFASARNLGKYENESALAR